MNRRAINNILPYASIYFHIPPRLVGGLEHGWIMNFHSVGKFIIPTDEIIFFRGVGIPPTSISFYVPTGYLT
jgi:hypothetical protein